MSSQTPRDETRHSNHWRCCNFLTRLMLVCYPPTWWRHHLVGINIRGTRSRLRCTRQWVLRLQGLRTRCWPGAGKDRPGCIFPSHWSNSSSKACANDWSTRGFLWHLHIYVNRIQTSSLNELPQRCTSIWRKRRLENQICQNFTKSSVFMRKIMRTICLLAWCD